MPVELREIPDAAAPRPVLSDSCFRGDWIFWFKGRQAWYLSRERPAIDCRLSLSPSLFFSVPLVLYSAIHVHDTNLPLKNRRYPAITLAGYRKFETRNNGGTMDATLVFRPPSIGMYSGLIFNRGFSVKNVKYREGGGKGRRMFGKLVNGFGLVARDIEDIRYFFFFFGNWKLKLFVTFNDFFFLKGYSFCCYISLDGILISLIGSRVFLNFELLIETFWFIFFL